MIIDNEGYNFLINFTLKKTLKLSFIYYIFHYYTLANTICCDINIPMRCIKCGCMDDKVVDSRMSKDGTAIRRRRICLNCEARYTTYEQIERTELRVIKKGDMQELFNREKILNGLIKACEKRPVSMETLDRAVDEIVSQLHKEYNREVPSSHIGQIVMNKLHELDPVAYIRYVSVYRQFQNVDEFIEEILALRNYNKG